MTGMWNSCWNSTHGYGGEDMDKRYRYREIEIEIEIDGE
jgi:hypothetical protein